MRSDIMEQAQKLKVRIDKNQRIADAVDAAGGITVTLEQSDKLGFDWRVYAVNRVIVRKEYVAQANPAGTADNPIQLVTHLTADKHRLAVGYLGYSQVSGTVLVQRQPALFAADTLLWHCHIFGRSA